MSDSLYPSADVINRFLELQPARVLDHEGFSYLDKDASATLITPPVPTAIGISSLVGFVDLLEAAFEKFPIAETLVFVRSFDRVDLIADHSDKYGRRQVYITANLMKPEREFSFNTFMPQEDFIIKLRSLFQQDTQLDDLVRVAGTLSANTEIKQEDDGFTQRATMQAGVVMVKEKTILPRVTLVPFRTFREAKQPSSEYVFRVKHDERQGNTCALFDADGGYWKLQAIENIKAYLSNRMKGSAVLGIGDIPVIA